MPDDLDGLDVEVLRLPGLRGSRRVAGCARHLARRAVPPHRHPARLGRRRCAARDRDRGRPRRSSCTAPPAKTVPASSWRSRCSPSASTATPSSTTTRAPRRTSRASGSKAWSSSSRRYGVPDTPRAAHAHGRQPARSHRGRHRRRRASTRVGSRIPARRRARTRRARGARDACSIDRGLTGPHSRRLGREPRVDGCRDHELRGRELARAAAARRRCLPRASRTSARRRAGGTGCTVSRPVSASSTGDGGAEPERRRVDARPWSRRRRRRRAARTPAVRSPRGIRQSPVDAAERDRVTERDCAHPVAEALEIGEHDLDVGARLVHDRQLLALVVPRSVRPDPQLAGRPGVEGTGCLELAHLGDEPLVRARWCGRARVRVPGPDAPTESETAPSSGSMRSSALPRTAMTVATGNLQGASAREWRSGRACSRL